MWFFAGKLCMKKNNKMPEFGHICPKNYQNAGIF